MTASVPTPMARWASAVDTLPGTYTLLGSVAEFSHGVLVTTDIKERLAWRVDVEAGTRRPFSAKGGGPGEYEAPGDAVSIGHDSVALVDATAPKVPILSVNTGRGRTHFLRHRYAPGGVVGGSLSAGEPWLQYADTLGNLYGAPITTAPIISPQTGRRDISTMHALEFIPVVRYSLITERVDTLEYMPRGVPVVASKREGNTRVSGMDMGRYGSFNRWTVTSDGRLVIADAAQYTLKVSDAAGADTQVVTWQIAGNVIPVSASSWKTYVDQATTGGDAQAARIAAGVLAPVGGALPAVSATRYIVPPKPRVLPYLDLDKSELHEHAGILWVPVHVSDPPGTQHWDLVDLATGQRLNTVELPANQYLMHVTARGAYVVAYDEDDVGRLLLYRPPRAPTTADSTRR